MSGRDVNDARGDWLFDGAGEPDASEREVVDALRGARWKGDADGLNRAIGREALAGEPPVAQGGATLAGKPPVAQGGATLAGKPPVAQRGRRWLAGAIAAAAAVLVAVNVWAFFLRAEPAWRSASGGGWAVGEWLETRAGETLEVASDIGRVTVGPRSRVRLKRAAEDEHRIELAEGSIEAFIFAPPRLFIVDTPAATAVDMGCAYRLDVAPDGSGLLRVTGGWVELQGSAVVSRVPAGAACGIGEDGELGIPTFEDASSGFLAALTRFEAGTGEALGDVLDAARPRDSLTLWHLLSRTSGEGRASVAERLAALAPPPLDGAVVERALALDQAALETWWIAAKRVW